MAEEPENLTLRILQEMRDEMRQTREEMRSGFNGVEETLTDLGQRVDGNTLLLNLIAGVVHDHETRIDKLESR